MPTGKHLDLGAFAKGTANYSGHHRYGVALIPVGDRHRADYDSLFLDDTKQGMGIYEERDSLDLYSKFL